MNEENKLLAWFLGPKSENAPFLEEAILLLLRDYEHWRKNYFPGDDMLITRQYQRELETSQDAVYQKQLELMAELRRNFPFYSPRYIAHQLSDTLLTSIIGYFAGMIYNPNNVTPEAAPVTVGLEIEACNTLLEMLGFTPPPRVPKEFTKDSIEKYKKGLEAQFGWGHITSGGTIANLEALWVARAIKYSPLAIWDIAKEEGLNIEVKMPDGKSSADIKDLTANQIVNIKPNESIYLLAKYVDAFRMKTGKSIQDVSNEASELLKKSPYHLSNGVAKIFQEFPPVIFVSGTAHYSIHKAADILGIGGENIKFIKMDSSFKMDIADLEKNIRFALANKKNPLAVISIIGTTEEGAVDPVHKVLDLRTTFEEQNNLSFWIHVDAAWGGYFRSLFNLAPKDEMEALIEKAASLLSIRYVNPQDWVKKFFEHVNTSYATHISNLDSIQESDITKEKNKIQNLFSLLDSLAKQEEYKEFIRVVRKFIGERQYIGLDKGDFVLNLNDRVNLINEYVSDTISINYDDYSKDVPIKWGAKEICSAFLGMSGADSITVDPHKMGYINYPCGMVAFKNDRVRHFILEKAPYITSVRQDILIHQPPEHISEIDSGNPKRIIEAFAPYTAEGSRPGAAASALWLTLKAIPPTMKESGLIIKSSTLAARELYEWLVHWEKIATYNQNDTDYQFVPLTLYPPDTNIVIFCIKRKTSNSVLAMNSLTLSVYENFTIQAELGENEYSYYQPFFLSKTEFREPLYPFESLKPLFSKYSKEHIERIGNEYKKHGLVVLRATVMNPYIWVARNLSARQGLKDFMRELSKATSLCLKNIDSNN